jgi:hypothetical protein
MADEPISLRPIVDAIEKVEEALRALPAAQDAGGATERNRVLMILDGAKQVVRGVCHSEDPKGDFVPVHALPDPE